jgi:hypothetical protein
VAHETAARVRSCGTGVGRGTRSACQARPFQRAATGRAPAGPEPAAWQKPGAGHDTLVSGPAGGRGTTDHWVPVHASAGVPTARQEVHSAGMLAMQGVGAAIAGAVAERTSPGTAMAVMAVISIAVTVALAPGLRPDRPPEPDAPSDLPARPPVSRSALRGRGEAVQPK